MTDRPKRAEVTWNDVAESADIAFSVFLGNPELKWAKQAWDMLSKSRLTSYATDTQRYTVLFRFLVLAGVYRDFCDAALEEHSYLEYDHWAEPLGLNDSLVFQMAAKDKDWEINEDASMANALLFLVEKHRDEVVQSLLNGFGGKSMLFQSLWLVTHTPMEDDADAPLTQDDAFWPVTGDRMSAFEWVSEGCPRYR